MIRYLDGKLELKGGSKEDRTVVREWISMFLNDAVVGKPVRMHINIICDVPLWPD